jgi:hypothetical protein
MFFVLRFLAHWLLVFITIFSLMGCYAIQIWKGDKRVDITALQPGVTRANAEAILGSPVRSWTSPTNIRYATYEYYAGTPPNPRMGVTWVFLDIGSLGVIEIMYALGLVPFPASWDGMTWDRKVLSCDDRVVLGIFDEFDELPLDGRSGQHKWGPDSTVSEK